MFAQYYPSKPKYANDSAQKRKKWFQQGLDTVEEQLISTNKITSIAFPYKIGCGLAGGEWEEYESMISAFASRNQGVRVVIHKLPDP